MSKIGKTVARIGVTAAAAAAAVSVVAAGTASADTFIKLPDGQKIVTAPDGWSVVLKSSGNSAKILPSMATAQTRTVWVDSKGSVDVKAPASAKDIDGMLGIGIVSGCQFPGKIGGSVGVTGPGATAGIGGTGTPNAGLSLGGVTGGLSIPLTPGGTDSVTGYSVADQLSASAKQSISFKKAGTYNVVLKDYDLNYKNCSGYAQARIVTFVEIKGSNRVQGFLYGAPFSMG